jgi:ABC-type multidrug transport system ATPase subunit
VATTREEADVLGDRIAIMSHGEIKCLGTPLHLKNKFGDGYRINITARPDAIEEAKAHIIELLPGTRTRHTTHDTRHTTHDTRHTTHDTRHTTHDTRHDKAMSGC